MIERIGLDVVEVARIAKAMNHPAFLARILTSAEQELSLTPTRVAGRWAAKEALSKCLPRLRRWQDVEILNHADGSPTVTFRPGIVDADLYRVHLSISHENGIAAAVAVLERVGLS